MARQFSNPPPESAQVPRKVFVNSRLAMLSYLRWEDDPENKALIEAGARRFGYNKVEYVENRPNASQACIFINTETHEAVVAVRGTEGGLDCKNIATYLSTREVRVAEAGLNPTGWGAQVGLDWGKNIAADLSTPEGIKKMTPQEVVQDLEKAVATNLSTEKMTPQEESNAQGWLTNMRYNQIHDRPIYGDAAVHAGFDAAAKSIEAEVSAKLIQNGVQSVEVAGHSKGGGTTKLLSVQLASDPALAERCRVTGSYAYEPPGVTDSPKLAERYRTLHIEPTTIVHLNDPVPGVGAQNKLGQFFSSYHDGIGGRDPNNPTRGVGDLYYINTGGTVWQNPAQDYVGADKDSILTAPVALRAFPQNLENHFLQNVEKTLQEDQTKGHLPNMRQLGNDYVTALKQTSGDTWKAAQTDFDKAMGAHFGFERPLFENMPKKDQDEWQAQLQRDAAEATRELSHAKTQADRHHWEIELRAIKREERAIQEAPVLADGRRMDPAAWSDPDGKNAKQLDAYPAQLPQNVQPGIEAPKFRSHLGEAPTFQSHLAAVRGLHPEPQAHFGLEVPTFRSHLGEAPTFGSHMPAAHAPYAEPLGHSGIEAPTFRSHMGDAPTFHSPTAPTHEAPAVHAREESLPSESPQLRSHSESAAVPERHETASTPSQPHHSEPAQPEAPATAETPQHDHNVPRRAPKM